MNSSSTTQIQEELEKAKLNLLTSINKTLESLGGGVNPDWAKGMAEAISIIENSGS